MLIIGAKGFAKEVLEILLQQEYHEEIMFFDDMNEDITGRLFSKYLILKSITEAEKLFKSGKPSFTIGVGGPLNRKKLYDKFSNLGGMFASTISPFAHIGHLDNILETGINLMTGSILTNSISIGKGCLINLDCTIGHDCKIGEFVEMSPSVNISGNCEIGKYSNIGTGVIILPGVKIGTNSIIGAGTVVTKDIPSNVLVVGVPGRIIKNLESFNV